LLVLVAFLSFTCILIINQIQDCVFLQIIFSDAPSYQICHQTRNHKATNKASSHLVMNNCSAIVSSNTPRHVLYCPHIMPLICPNVLNFVISTLAQTTTFLLSPSGGGALLVLTQVHNTTAGLLLPATTLAL
jgi:hypothetical protein